MTLEALRCLCAVIEVKGFRSAAERLHRSQSAISQQVKALEQETGHTLVDRKSCRPTPAGELLYERSRRILNDAEALERLLRDFDETEASDLRLGTSDTTALYLLPEAVRAFSKAFPKTRLSIVNRSSDAIAELVRRGELDLGIVTLPLHMEDLTEQALFDEELVLVVPRNHALAGAAHASLGELRNEPLLLLEPETRTGRLLREHFLRKGFTPQTVLQSGSFEVIKRYVAEGIGLAFLPELTVSDHDRHLRKVPVQGLPRVQIGAIWRKGAYRKKTQQAFIDLLAR
ncbi:MAG: LysR substrate-binding domain-containing protein [FCB group bacterium]|jgi:LysR family hydrogen peroxide-inducible transcriptional activator|nr:LysR substrate-binding domain-containing protein [FCB group bacterium]